ncbi:MAG: hypothetical protein Q9173_000258 [Seirophora scorigena]
MAESSFKIVRGHGTSKCADYNVAWICALRDTELLAARGLLDEEHTTPPYDTRYDRNTYICGKIGEHMVVVACMPSGRSGNVNAGHLTGPLFHTFPNIKITLLVGIGGGVPRQGPQDPLEDIYLGDVVIGWPGDGTPSVVQYDSGRWKVDGFEQRGSVDQPDWHLTQALDIVVSNHEVGQTDFAKSIARLRKIPKFASRRSDEEDRLFQPTYKHEGDYYSQCRHCIPTQLVNRPGRAEARPEGSFRFHQGTIASGGAVIQDGEMRDRLSRECNNARCLEMEAVGVNLNSRCLVIRGVADYADSHKNDVWKFIAAGNAAAFAKEFLLTIKGSGLKELSRIVPDQRSELDMSFDDAYRRIAKELEIPGYDDPLFEHRKAVPRELDRRETGPWIMIIDNADDYNVYFPPLDAALSESEQRQYFACCLPYGAENEGRIIITTRNKRVGEAIMGDSPIIEIPELAPVDARKLLRSKVPKEKWDDVAANMLLKELDYLPLAITQAAAFVKRNKLTSLKFYLGKLCQFHLNVQDVLSKQLHDSRRQPGTPNAIFRTWQISYRQIELENTEAANKLSLMAVLDNQAIPRLLLASGDVSEEVAEMEALQVLLDFSLIKGDGDGEFFSMHPLQQLVSSFRPPSYIHRCINEHMRHRCSILLPHAKIVVSYESQKLDCRSLLLYKMASYERDLGRYQDCYQHAIQSYKESLEAHGKNSAQAHICRNQLEIALIHLGKENELAALPHNDKIKAFVIGEVDEAQAAYDSAMKKRRNNTDPVGVDLDVIFALLQKALDRFRACSNDTMVFRCLDEQALIAERQGRLAESESLSRQALQSSLNVFGAKNPEVFKCMHKVGLRVQKQGKFEEATRLHRLALQGREKIYGMENPTTMESNQHLSLALRDQGHLVEAEVLGRQTAEYMQRHLGWHHFKTRDAANELFITLDKMGKENEAVKLYDEIKFHSVIVPVAFGTDRESTPFTQDNLSEAGQTLRKTLEKSQEQIDSEPWDHILKLELLAKCLEMQEDWEAAEKYRRKSLELYKYHEVKANLGTVAFYKKRAVTLSVVSQLEILDEMESFHPSDTSEIQICENIIRNFGTLNQSDDESDEESGKECKDENVDRITPAQDALPTPSADNERHPDSMASSADIQRHEYLDRSPPRKRTKF